MFKPVKEFPVADALSRLRHEDELDGMAELREEINVHAIMKAVPIGDKKKDERDRRGLPWRP